MAVALIVSAGLMAQSTQTQTRTQTQTQTQVQDPAKVQTQTQTGDQAVLQTRTQARQQLKLQDGSCVDNPAQTQARMNSARQSGSGSMARARARVQDPANCGTTMMRNNVRSSAGTGRR